MIIIRANHSALHADFRSCAATGLGYLFGAGMQIRQLGTAPLPQVSYMRAHRAQYAIKTDTQHLFLVTYAMLYFALFKVWIAANKYKYV